MLDRFECYELCVQSPRHITGFLRAVHGAKPISLREDFAGAAAVSRQWCREAKRSGDAGRAMAIDIDPEASDRAAVHVGEAGLEDLVRVVFADCLGEAAPDDAADVVFVGNFSIGYIHERATLVRYLRAARSRLNRGNAGFGGGVFACDTYGGASAFKLGGLERKHPGRHGEVIRYSWVHEKADPLTSMVENSMSFRVEVDGDVVQEWPRAFVYRWRLWGIAELRDAMRDAGFGQTVVYVDVNVAPEHDPLPARDGQNLGEDWIVLVVGRA
jgi:hypothetical protein